MGRTIVNSKPISCNLSVLFPLSQANKDTLMNLEIFVSYTLMKYLAFLQHWKDGEGGNQQHFR